MMRLIAIRSLNIICLVLITVATSVAQSNERPTPDVANAKYGAHERNVLDVWFADAIERTPLVMYIHGGGFVNGSKDGLKAAVINEFLEAGISVAAVNYRYLKQTPLPAAHHDVRRSLQFIRLNAGEWNIDKTRIGAFGGSAGAQLSMWLAFSDEMANPESTDPVERESSRLYCVATNGGQTTMDFDLWRAWLPEFVVYRSSREDIFGSLTEEEYKTTIERISAISIVSSDDPPIFMSYGMKPDDPVPTDPKKAQGWKIHHVNFGIKLKEKMDELGVEADLSYPTAQTKYENRFQFLKLKLH